MASSPTAAKPATSPQRDSAREVQHEAHPSTASATMPAKTPDLSQRLLALQRASGNQAVSRGIGSGTLPVGIPVGAKDDSREKEADRVASRIVNKPNSDQAVEEAPPARRHFPGGQPLNAADRQFFEARFGVDFRNVRVHVNHASAEMVSAHALTVGQDIVFGDGKYAPGSPEGRKLLAHELTHVVQQSGARNLAGVSGRFGVPVIQRQPKKPEEEPERFTLVGKFGSQYKKQTSWAATKYQKYLNTIDQPDEIRGKQEKMQSAHEWGGTQVDPVEISAQDLKDILNPPGEGHRPELDATLERYRGMLNTAFATFGIDTVESQALYLAHAAGETGSFAKLGEQPLENKEYKGFEGRGPIQVTWEENYVQSLAYLERMLITLKEKAKTKTGPPDPKDQELINLIEEAVVKIKADPKNAVDPKYTFLFSAAFMHAAGGVRRSASEELKKQGAPFSGHGIEDTWVAGSRDNAGAAVRTKAALAELQRKKADAAVPDEEKPTEGAITKAKNSAQEAESVLKRSKVKAKTYALAVEVLGRKKVAR